MNTVGSDIASGISTVGSIFTGIWNFITDNPIVLVMVSVSVVMMGVLIFKRIKSRLGGN